MKPACPACGQPPADANPVTRMTGEDFERHLRALMRRDPGLLEQFLRRLDRIHGRSGAIR